MNFRIILFIVLGFFIFNSLANTHAARRTVDMLDLVDFEPEDTSSRKPNPDSIKDARSHINDSIRIAREHSTDSMREAREHITDSTTTAREHKTDSIQKAHKHIADSTASLRKYRESKHYKDSVSKARNTKATALKKSRSSRMDSIKEARKANTDSLTASRKNKTDSVKTSQKKRTDSLAKVKKYRASKRYTDSVGMVRRNHTDSVKEAQENFKDSISKVRKHSLDSTKTVRKKSTDSLKRIRTKTTDSLVKVRKARVDSFAKVKKQKEALAKAKVKKKDDDKKLKLEIKMKQKHEKWSNAAMLKRRWSPFRRLTQNSFTHYNYYYNANKKMDEALQNMQRSRKENYDSLIGLYPFDPNRDSSMMSSDMDTIVRKISVGIQIHDPRVKWSNDLYLLMGEAYYYRGKYEYAATSFRYIISQDEAARKKELASKGFNNSSSKNAPSIVDEEKKSRLDFLKHKSVHNEAILWLARTYTEGHQVENAESILSLLETDKNLPEDLKGRLAIEKAFAFLTEHNDRAASKQLDIAADDSHLPNWLRLRAAFLNGQILQNLEDYKASALSFEKVISYYPKIEMDFYSRKYIATNRLLSGEDVEDAMKPLKKVLNDGKYVTYYDQVYFVMGQLAVKAHKNDKAITYLTKSANTPKASKKQKALSYAALGDVYYATASYANAKWAYDSSAKYASAAAKDNSVLAAVQRAKGLEEVSGPAKMIHDQDSLMELAGLSKKEQMSAVRRSLRDMEKKLQDSITKAENSGVTAVAALDPDDNKDAANWYFSNPTLMQQGKTDFIKKWGNRPLKDNWRLAPAVPGAGNGPEDDFTQAGDLKENGLPTEESLLARIPNTQPQKDLSAKMEQRAYIMLAKAYIKQLDDYKMASATLDTLDIRFPNHNQKEEALFLRYQIAMKQENLALAKKYSDELLAKYPTSQYVNIVKPRTSESKPEALIGGKTVARYYDETYNMVMKHQYTEALMNVREARKQYDNPAYQKRFDVVEAMAYAGSADYNMADSSISKFLKAYPKDTLTPWATEVKQYIKEVRNGGKPSWYNENNFKKKDSALAVGPVTPVFTPVKPSAPVAPSNVPPRYIYHADSAHYCIIVLPGVDSRTAGLKQSLKDINNSKYAATGLELLFDLYNIDQGVLVIRKFANVIVAKAYLEDLMATESFKGYAPDELKVMLISSDNYRKMLTDRDASPYYNFYKANY